MQSKAATVPEYLASLPADRREAIEAVRAVILKHLGKGFTEGMQYGMITYAVPHSIYPAGYHCDPRQPLPFAALASQKGYMSIYLSWLYGSPSEEARFRAQWAKSGKKLDMGKSCLRFKKLDDLCLDLIGEAIASVPVAAYIKRYEASLAASGRPAPKTAAKATPTPSSAKKKTVAKKTATKATARTASSGKSTSGPAKKAKSAARRA
jgi:hypothetical protein